MTTPQKLRDRWLQAGAPSDLATELAALEVRVRRLEESREHDEFERTDDTVVIANVPHLRECRKVQALCRSETRCTCGSQPDSTTSMGDLDEI
jgi:hypothetical protein